MAILNESDKDAIRDREETLQDLAESDLPCAPIAEALLEIAEEDCDG